jgi:multidrug transporter EmrE-like cation transporter
MEKTPFSSIIMFILAALLGAVGSWLYKSGAATADGSLRGYLLNPRIGAGVICYSSVMVLFVAAFRNGGALTVLYPTYASTFVFSAVIAFFAYGTPIRAANVFGMSLLVTGMYFMGKQ